MLALLANYCCTFLHTRGPELVLEIGPYACVPEDHIETVFVIHIHSTSNIYAYNAILLLC